MHDFGLLLRDAQKIYGEWQTGIRITNEQARKAELASHNQKVCEDYFAKKERQNAMG
jgi:hypothetical protein